MRWSSRRADPVEAERVEAADQILDLDEPAPAPAVLPAVNLLPARYARAGAVRRARAFAVAAVLVALLVGVLALLVGTQQVRSAQEGLDRATDERVALQREAARYADVPLVFQAVDTARAQLGTAMANEVRWSFVLNDLALVTPAGISLDSIDATAPAPGEQVATTGQVGAMTVTGKALALPHVAAWLDSLAKLPTAADPYLDSVSEVDEEGSRVFTFGTGNQLTAAVLSGRYAQQEVAR